MSDLVKADVEAREANLGTGEQWKLTQTVIYFRAPHEIGRSKFTEKLDRYFKARTTARNLKTSGNLPDMVHEITSVFKVENSAKFMKIKDNHETR